MTKKTYIPKNTPDSPGGPGVTVYSQVPDMEVVVTENNSISEKGVLYETGDSLTLEGPTALSFAQLGYVTIKEN